MNKKLLLICIAVLALIGTLYYLNVFNSGRNPGMEDGIVSEQCNDLDEDGCSKDPRCRSIFGPSFCEEDTCTTDVAYQGCGMKN